MYLFYTPKIRTVMSWTMALTNFNFLFNRPTFPSLSYVCRPPELSPTLPMFISLFSKAFNNVTSTEHSVLSCMCVLSVSPDSPWTFYTNSRNSTGSWHIILGRKKKWVNEFECLWPSPHRMDSVLIPNHVQPILCPRDDEPRTVFVLDCGSCLCCAWPWILSCILKPFTYVLIPWPVYQNSDLLFTFKSLNPHPKK